MKLPFTPSRWVIGAIALCLIAGAATLSTVRPGANESKVTKMNQKMVTVCVGRFTIDLPEGAQIEFTPARIAGVNINVHSGYTEQEMKSDIVAFEQALAPKKNEYDRPSLEKKLVVDAINFKSTLFHFGREKPVALMENGKRVPGTEEGINIEAFGLKNSVAYRFSGEHLASPRGEENVFRLVKNFEALTSNQLPTHPGFCLEQGMVRDPLGADNNESVTMFASLKGHPDVAIRLDTSINLNRIEDGLLSRDDESETKREFKSSFISLRKGSRTINGIAGEEVLDKVKDLNGTVGHGFMWEATGKMKDVLAPAITLELQTGKGRPGKPMNSSISDEEVLKLWDRVSSSLKLRATSEGTTTRSAVVPNVAVGELAATGRTCPQTGYWECKESKNVVGGSRRFFRQGETMPGALLRAAPSLWQALSGTTQTKQVSTVWKLVDFAESHSVEMASSAELSRKSNNETAPPPVSDPDQGCP